MNKAKDKTAHTDISFYRDYPEFQGFEYITLRDVPIKLLGFPDTQYEIRSKTIKVIIAKIILTHTIPIRGKELKYLREVADYSQEKLAAQLGITASAVCRWERNKKERLSLINEIAVRFFFIEKFKLKERIRFSQAKSFLIPTTPIIVAADKRVRLNDLY